MRGLPVLDVLTFVLAAMAVIVALQYLADRTGLPAAALLTVAGLVYGVLPGPNVTLDPHVILTFVIPPLIYSAALNSSLQRARAVLQEHLPPDRAAFYAGRVPRQFRQVDVFTETPYLGNPVAVVLGADGLSAEQMQLVARWTNLSETAFVLAPRASGADYQVRIFTPARELPFAGHPTLGTAHVVRSLAATLQERVRFPV